MNLTDTRNWPREQISLGQFIHGWEENQISELAKLKHPCGYTSDSLIWSLKFDKDIRYSEKAMAPHSTLAWEIPWTEEPGRLQSMESQSQTRLNDFALTFHFYSLEKEMATHSSVLAWRIPGMGAWWAAIYGVTQSWTWLTWLSSSSSSMHVVGRA